MIILRPRKSSRHKVIRDGDADKGRRIVAVHLENREDVGGKVSTISRPLGRRVSPKRSSISDKMVRLARRAAIHKATGVVLLPPFSIFLIGHCILSVESIDMALNRKYPPHILSKGGNMAFQF